MGLLIQRQSACTTNNAGRQWVWSILIAIAFTFCFSNVLATLVQAWKDNGAYSHGVLVPFISLYLLWLKREDLSRVPHAPSYRIGVPVMVIGLLMLLAANAGGVQIVEELSLIVAIFGIVLLMFGSEFCIAAWFPLFYLSFMLTVWGDMVEPLQSPLQSLSAAIAARFIELTAIPVHREATYLMLPNITLEVARQCSGANNLIAVLALGLLLAYIYLKGWSRRAMLIIIGISVAVLFNGLRIGFIGFMAFYGISEVLHGPFHILQAMSVSVIGYAVLFVSVWLLARGERVDALREKKPSAESDDCEGVRRTRGRSPIILVLILLSVAGLFVHLRQPDAIPLGHPLSSFPAEIGNFQWAVNAVVARPDGFPLSDSELNRVYLREGLRKIELHVGYFEGQTRKKELVSHQMRDILREASISDITVDGIGTIKVNKIGREGGNDDIVLTWFVVNGRHIAEPVRAKLYTVWDALVHGRTNGAVVAVTAHVPHKSDHQEIERDALTFIRKLIPALQDIFPEQR